jgi:hypothetical protein
MKRRPVQSLVCIIFGVCGSRYYLQRQVHILEEKSVVLVIDTSLIVDEIFIHHKIIKPLLLNIVELIKSGHLGMRNKVLLSSP